MWKYVDETGNTGNNLFDPERPLFITAAFMTKSNFDLVEGEQLPPSPRR